MKRVYALFIVLVLTLAFVELSAQAENTTLQAEGDLLLAEPIISDPSIEEEAEDVLRSGSQGDKVILLQTYLKELGYYSTKIDNVFGPGLLAAVQNYQQSRELETTGTVDEGLFMQIRADYMRSRCHIAPGMNILVNSGNPKINPDFTGSQYETGLWRWASDGTGTRDVILLPDSPIAGLKYGIRFTATPEDLWTDIAINDVPVEYGEYYVLSCYVRGSGIVRLQHGKNGWASKQYDATDSWQRVSYVFQIGAVDDGSTLDKPYNNVYFGVGPGENVDVTMCGFKLEKACPTPWNE